MHRSPAQYLAVLGSHDVDAGLLAKAFRLRWPMVFDMVGFKPGRLITGCADRGVELAARLAARDITGQLAVIFHRASFCGTKKAEEILDKLLAQEADALLIVSTGGKVCTRVRDLFTQKEKRVIEIEIEDN